MRRVRLSSHSTQASLGRRRLLPSRTRGNSRQDARKTAQDASKSHFFTAFASRGVIVSDFSPPNRAKTPRDRCLAYVCFQTFPKLKKSPQDGPRPPKTLPRCPKTPQDVPKAHPGRPQDGHKMAQEPSGYQCENDDFQPYGNSVGKIHTSGLYPSLSPRSPKRLRGM